MFYHASQTKYIEVLEPHVSNHNKPLVYFSSKRENVLVYLSNAVEKYCKEHNFIYEGSYSKWGPYGFDEDGTIRIEEYYPNALIDTYKGVSGFIYKVNNLPNGKSMNDIPNAFISDIPVKVDECEYVKDAYQEILKAEVGGLVRITRYSELSAKKKEWIRKTIIDEYNSSSSHPEYQFFLRNIFDTFFK